MARNESDCILLLQNKAKSLNDAGEERFPRRADFSEEESAAIKAFLGPWPRALEKAGLKTPDPARETRKKLRREALNRRKGQYRANRKRGPNIGQ